MKDLKILTTNLNLEKEWNIVNKYISNDKEYNNFVIIDENNIDRFDIEILEINKKQNNELFEGIPISIWAGL